MIKWTALFLEQPLASLGLLKTKRNSCYKQKLKLTIINRPKYVSKNTSVFFTSLKLSKTYSHSVFFIDGLKLYIFEGLKLKSKL